MVFWCRTTRSIGVIALVGALGLAACGGGADDAAGGADSVIPLGPVATVERRAGDTVIAIVGDAGELNDDTLAVSALIDARQPDAVFTGGDNEYTTEGRTVAAFEESVGGVYGNWIDAGAFFPIPGDHDYGDRCDDRDAPADLDAYLEYFALPVGPEDETYYEARIGDIHVFALDSLETCHRDDGAKLERQRQWLANEASASDAAFTIVLLHQPPSSSGSSHGSAEALRWDFADWGVDLVVSGDEIDRFELSVPIETTSPSPANSLSVETTWQWQLQGDINTGYDVDLYDIDLFDTPDSAFDALRADGRVVICYFSAGSYEGWRPDADGFTAADLGSTLDQLDFNRYLTDAARGRGLLVGLKNSGDQVVDLVDHFDFAVSEQCHEFAECDQVAPFIVQGKPVFNAEYQEDFIDDPRRVCESARSSGFRTLILPLDLDDSFRISCD